MVMFGPYRDDLAAAQPDFHQFHQVGPSLDELSFTDRPTGPVRIDAMPKQQLVTVNVANAGDDGLVHQQCADWPARLGNPRPRPRRIGVATKRVGPEPGDHVGDLSLVDNLTHRGTA